MFGDLFDTVVTCVMSVLLSFALLDNAVNLDAMVSDVGSMFLQWSTFPHWGIFLR